MTDDKPGGKGCALANANYAWVATVPLCVHEGGETEPGDDSPEEDQVKPVRVVSHGV